MIHNNTPIRNRDRGERQAVVYCHLPGLLAHTAREEYQQGESATPVIVSDGRSVRDACPLAVRRGVRVGGTVVQARRLCPASLVVPLTSLSPKTLTTTFLDRLADLTPTVEPLAEDAAVAELSYGDWQRGEESLIAWATNLIGLAPRIGVGSSRLAARACAECDLPPFQFAPASVRHLWPEDPKVTGRLERLGLATFGDVSALSESVLVHQFGKIGRLLSRRSQGVDMNPVRPLYPPPRADARLDLAEHPIQDSRFLDTAVTRLSNRAASQLRSLGRHGRRVVLRLETELGEIRRERVSTFPVQNASELLSLVRHLAAHLEITAPVTSLRLLVDDTEIPTARTLTLFPDKAQQRDHVLHAVRQTLHTRFGAQSLSRLSELPVPIRDERRMLTREAWQIR